MIVKNSLEENIVFLGYLDRSEFHKRMNDVDVYIQASPFEGYGNSVVEALCEGKDILISDTGYIAETIRKKFPNHIIRSLEPSGLADSMNEFARSTFGNKEAEKIREYLTDMISRETVTSKWKTILSNISDSDIQTKNGSICNAVMFHDVDNTYTGIDYSRDGFGKLVEGLYTKGIRLCSAREYFKSQVRDNLIVCTFDDGYENVFKNAFPIMKKFGFSATIYICPDLIGKSNDWNHKDETNRWHLTHEMINNLVAEGWEVGSHGLSHINMRRLSEHELERSLIESKKLLEIYGTIESFCYPYGAFNDFIKGKVSKYYSNAFSVSIGGNNVESDLYQITRLTPEELMRRLELN
jgi:peptidoglycan/xylan/chitin deacetylase (PgdA/CDA1 family)